MGPSGLSVGQKLIAGGTYGVTADPQNEHPGDPGRDVWGHRRLHDHLELAGELHDHDAAGDVGVLPDGVVPGVLPRGHAGRSSTALRTGPSSPSTGADRTRPSTSRSSSPASCGPLGGRAPRARRAPSVRHHWAGDGSDSRPRCRCGTRRRAAPARLRRGHARRSARRGRVLREDRGRARRGAAAAEVPARHGDPAALPPAAGAGGRGGRRARPEGRGVARRDGARRRARRRRPALAARPDRRRAARLRRLHPRRRRSARLRRELHADRAHLRRADGAQARPPCAGRRNGQRHPRAARRAGPPRGRRGRRQSACARVHGVERRAERLRQRRVPCPGASSSRSRARRST